MKNIYPSWGNYPPTHRQAVWEPSWRHLPLPPQGYLLPYGQGRSYGDVCATSHGTLLSTRRLNHFMAFDTATGLLTVEAGVTIADIHRLTIPRGWLLPVMPGTKFVSVGGAIANDVHGKNHHRLGTFGCHVTQLELVHSHAEPLICSPSQNPEFFRATIGGLGLTGLITWAQIQLRRIQNPYLNSETIRMQNIKDFMRLSRESDITHEYTVAWLDTTAKGSHIGRGLFMRANHAAGEETGPAYRPPLFTMPALAPNWLISTPAIKAFNMLYYRKQFAHHTNRRTHYDPFFYPLDRINYWNRLYGSRGLQSYHCVVPQGSGQETIKALLSTIQASGHASPLTVLKIFGTRPSPGLLSFPRPGINLLLDFANTPHLNRLFKKLDTILRQAGGRLNPSKDAHMSSADFKTAYPTWSEFAKYKDPRFTSDFWERVTQAVSNKQ